MRAQPSQIRASESGYRAETELFFPELVDEGAVRCLLWCLMSDLEEVRPRIAGRVDGDDLELKGPAYRAAFELLMDRQVCDAVDALMRASMSGNRELFELLNAVASTSYGVGTPRLIFAEVYADWVRTAAVRMRLQRVSQFEAQALMGQGCELPDGTRIAPGSSAAEVLAACGMARERLQKSTPIQLWGSLAVATEEALDELERIDQGEVVALQFGLENLDRILGGGLRAPQLVTLAGRPGTGKTALALQAIEHWALVQEKSGAIVSLEMLRHELGARSLSRHSGVSGSAMRGGRLHQDDWDALLNAKTQIDQFGGRIQICDVDTLTAAQIEAAIRPLASRGDLHWLVVDYLQLMKGDDDARNRSESVGENSTYLKHLAKRFGIPVLQLAQMNREVEKRAGPSSEPKTSDLRDSGQIEQDSDVIIFTGEGMLYVKKHRQGATGNALVEFHRETQTFTSSSIV